MKTRQNKRKADALLVLLLFGIFAVCILAVLLTGADAYRRLAQRDQDSYDRRTAAQYLSARVRQADRPGDVAVQTFDGVDALVLLEDIEGERYETVIYCHDGYLRELFVAAGSDFMPEDGEKILPVEDLVIRAEEPGLYIRVLTEGERQQELRLSLRSGREVAP